jgi:hypothetical protein
MRQRSSADNLVLIEGDSLDVPFRRSTVEIRGLMHESALAALPTPRDPDTLSFVHAVRVLRRTLPRVALCTS